MIVRRLDLVVINHHVMQLALWGSIARKSLRINGIEPAAVGLRCD